MEQYKRFFIQDDSYLAVERAEPLRWVDMHKHEYHELFLVEKGSCTHIFGKKSVMLIPGDCFLVPAHQAHGFTIHNEASIFNCQFFPEKLDERVAGIIPDFQTEGRIRSSGESGRFKADINKQGIIHLEPGEMGFLVTILYNMLEEQDRRGEHYDILKQKYLEIILTLLKRRFDQQYRNYFHQPKRNKTIILGILSYIEENLAGEIDFAALAAQNHFSVNYFRKLFKDSTGLSPVDYVNRLRVTRASDMLLTGGKSIGEIGASVGIFDYNYFSRLFRQYIGCSPRTYAKHPELF